jgi:hypothetical protein
MGRPKGLINSFVIKGNLAHLFLTQGKKTVIDRADLEKALDFHWYAVRAKNTWYAVSGRCENARRLHNVLTGFKPTDHLDGDGLNNRRSNRVERPLHGETP